MSPCDDGILTWSTCLARTYSNPEGDQAIEYQIGEKVGRSRD
jgi:hypothetical protein